MLFSYKLSQIKEITDTKASEKEPRIMHATTWWFQESAFALFALLSNCTLICCQRDPEKGTMHLITSAPT